MYVNIYSTDPNADQKDLVNFANDTVIPRIRRIKGMDVPRNLANRYSAVRVRLDPDRMRAQNLSPEDIRKALMPSGMIGPNVRLDEVRDKTLAVEGVRADSHRRASISRSSMKTSF